MAGQRMAGECGEKTTNSICGRLAFAGAWSGAQRSWPRRRNETRTLQSRVLGAILRRDESGLVVVAGEFEDEEVRHPGICGLVIVRFTSLHQR